MFDMEAIDNVDRYENNKTEIKNMFTTLYGEKSIIDDKHQKQHFLIAGNIMDFK